MSKDRNLVLVVDDDLGMLRAIKRLLRQHDYEPILFSSAQAFKCHADFEKAACVILEVGVTCSRSSGLCDRTSTTFRFGLIAIVSATDLKRANRVRFGGQGRQTLR